MASDTQKVKDRLPIEEVVGGYVELKQSGKYLKAKSPFTNENTPSFYVSPDKGLFHCFSSGKGGDIFTFIEEMEGVEFREALKLLADRAGVKLSGGKSDGGKKKRLRKIVAEARDFYQKTLQKKDGGQAYLEGRGLTQQTIDTFKLGQAPDEWREVLEHLESSGFKTEDIIEAGLAKRPDADKSPYDRFRNRVLFPLNDAAGRPVGFSGRRLSEDDPAKYINSPETPLYRKKRVLYGFDLAKDALREFDAAIVVEGQVDLVLAHQAGFKNTVASSGTAITKHHLKLLQRFTDNLILALDTDQAGRAATLKTARLALAAGMKPKVAALPDETDPADIITGDGKRAFRSLIAGAEDVITVALGWARERSEGRQAFLDALQAQVFPLLSAIENDLTRDHQIETVARLAEVRETTLRAELSKLEDESTMNQHPTTKEESSYALSSDDSRLTPSEQKENTHETILTFLAWQEELDNPNIAVAETKEQLAEVLSFEIGDREPPEVSEDDVFALEVSYEGAEADTIKRDITELILQFEQRILRETYGRAHRQIKKTDSREDKQALLEKCQRISARIQEVKEEIRELV